MFIIRTKSSEVPLWHDGIGSLFGALGHRFVPQPGTVGGLRISWSQLQLGSDPWLGNFICHKVVKKEKELRAK